MIGKIRDPNKSKRDIKGLQETLQEYPNDSPTPKTSSDTSDLVRTLSVFEEAVRTKLYVEKGSIKKIVVPVAFGFKITVNNVSLNVEKKNKAISGVVKMDVLLADPKKKGPDGNPVMVPETLADSEFKSGQQVHMPYEEKSDFHENVTFVFEFEGPDGCDAEIVILHETKAMAPEKLNIMMNRQKDYFFPPGRYKVSMTSDSKEEEVFLSCKIATKRPLVKKFAIPSDSLTFVVRKVCSVVIKVGLMANIKDEKTLDYAEQLSGKSTPYTLGIQQIQNDEWVTCWSTHTNKVMKPYFIKLLTHFSLERNEESLEEIEKTAKANTQYSAMESIKNYATKLKGKIHKEEDFVKELNVAMEERDMNLRLERLIKEAKVFNDEQFEGAGQLFQSTEMNNLISKAEKVLAEVKKEREFVWKLRELLANAWVEVKKVKSWNEEEARKIFKGYGDNGNQFPNLRSHYFFVLQCWHDFLDKSIPNVERIQYNILVFLKEQIVREKDFPYMKELANFDTKLRNKDATLTEQDIVDRKAAGKLYKSYHLCPIRVPIAALAKDLQPKRTYSDAREKNEDLARIEIARKKAKIAEHSLKAEYSFFERVLTFLYKNSIDLLSQLHENEISHPIALSQALIDGNVETIKELCDNSRVLDLSERGRGKVVINRIEKGQDYSDMLSTHESESINRHVDKFQSLFPSLAHLITKDMPLLKKVLIVKTRMSINVQEKERIIIPEILFLGDQDITFDRSVHEVASKNWIAELNKVGKSITLYLKKKKEMEPQLSVHEIFMEQTTGMNILCKSNGTYFTSEIDQFVRKRILPILANILAHRRKDNYQTSHAFEVVECLIQSSDPSKKYGKYIKTIKESATIEGLWQRTSENLGNVHLRILLCIIMNHHRLNNFFSTLFANNNLREYYSNNSFMRRTETQQALLKVFEKLEKFPFELVITMERNEYSTDKF